MDLVLQSAALITLLNVAPLKMVHDVAVPLVECALIPGVFSPSATYAAFIVFTIQESIVFFILASLSSSHHNTQIGGSLL